MEAKDVYLRLMERLGLPESQYLLKVFKKLVTPEDGELLLELPAEPADLASKCGLDESVVSQKLREFLEKGLVIPTSKGLQMARDVTQLHDATLCSAGKWVDEELLDLWKDFHEAEWIQNMVSALGDQYVQYISVVPAWKALERSHGISPSEVKPEESIRELIKGADPIAVVPCSCRRSMRRCDSPLDVCLQLNKGARYAIDRGAGRQITGGEAMHIAGQAEEAGLVHTVPGRASGRLNEICNCCEDCCVIFDAGLKLDKIEQILEKSRFRAVVDQELCTGCQDCVERCFFDAIQMVKPSGSKKLKAKIDSDKCFGCGLCVIACDLGAIALELPRN